MVKDRDDMDHILAAIVFDVTPNQKELCGKVGDGVKG